MSKKGLPLNLKFTFEEFRNKLTPSNTRKFDELIRKEFPDVRSPPKDGG